MSDRELRKGLIRIAHENPELRPKILPLLGGTPVETREAARGDMKNLLVQAQKIQVGMSKIWQGILEAERSIDILDTQIGRAIEYTSDDPNAHLGSAPFDPALDLLVDLEDALRDVKGALRKVQRGRASMKLEEALKRAATY
jgi:hypothetical protein